MRRIAFLCIGLLVCSFVVMAAETNLCSTKVVEGLKGQIGKAGRFITLSLENDQSPSDGQQLTWNAGDTVTWEAAGAGGGGGNVSNTGTPLAGQVAVFTDATTIEGTTALTLTANGLEVLANGKHIRFNHTGSTATIISDFGTQMLIQFSGNLEFNLANDTVGNAFEFQSAVSAELASSSAEQAWMYLEPKINQSGTANYVGFLMDVTETQLGSGQNYLMDLRVGGSPKFRVTNTGDVIQSGILNLNSNKIINVTDPTNDQDAATKIYVDAATSAFNVDFFFNNTASDVGGVYFDMTSAALGGGESLLGAALSASTNDQVIASFLTDDIGGLGILDIPAGTFEIHYHAERTAGTSPVNIYAKVYKRASGGAETLITTSQTSGFVTSKAEFSLFAHTTSDTDLLATDRIVVTFFGNLGSGSGATVALYQEGTTVSRLAFPTTTEILNQIFLRQDGTTPLAGPWDMDSQTITNLSMDADNSTITNIGSAEITNGSIVNDDINASAAIDASKLSGVTTPSSSDTFTNKTVDANGTGNVYTNFDEDNMLASSDIVRSGIVFIIDGGGSAITTGLKTAGIEIPFSCTIQRVTMLADQSTTTVVDIWVDTYGNAPPTVADTITASALPTITTALKSQDTTLTGWTTALAAGSIIMYNVNSNDNAEKLTISLVVEK